MKDYHKKSMRALQARWSVTKIPLCGAGMSERTQSGGLYVLSANARRLLRQNARFGQRT
jgi:hypothetical protein